MAKQSIFNVSPYYDDFDEDKNFLRMLFRPGYAVQARELTQAQTILQNQVERFGNHVFEDGARVLGAGITDRPVSFVRIDTTYTDPETEATKTIDLNTLIGYDIVGENANIDGATARARVVHAIGTDTNYVDDNFNILFLEYLEGSELSTEGNGAVLESSYTSETVKVSVATGGSDPNNSDDTTIYAGGLVGADLNGDATLASVDDGVFFVDGFFVKSQKNSIVPHGSTQDSKYRWFKSPTARVGFDIERGNITTADDDTLRDPSSGTYNFNAPGADRYRILLGLSQKSGATGEDINFLELLKYESGNVTYKLVKTNYAELEKTLARRTYDESGSYTVMPFEIDIREQKDDGTNRGISSGASDYTKLAVGLKSGKAYVFGHEYETQTPEYVAINKGRQTKQYTGNTFDASLGMYFIGTGDHVNGNDTQIGQRGAAWVLSRGDINKAPIDIVIQDNNELDLAYGKLHKLDRVPSGTMAHNFRCYVSDLKYATGVTKTDSMKYISIYDPTGEYDDDAANTDKLFKILASPSGITGPINRDEGALLFPAIGNSVKEFNKLKYSFKKTFYIDAADVSETGTATVTLSDLSDDGTLATYNFKEGNETDKDDFILWRQQGAGSLSGTLSDTVIWDDDVNGTGTLVTISSPGNKTISITGLQNATDNTNLTRYILQATVVYDNTHSGVTTLSSLGTRDKLDTIVAMPGENIFNTTRVQTSDGRVYYELENPDVYKITGIIATTATGDFDPSNDFMFDTGQTDTAYLKSRLWLKDGVTGNYQHEDGTNIDIKASYRYFRHTGGPGPFAVNSYTRNGFSFDNIPLYTSKNSKKTYSLANVLDFRHTGTSTITSVDDLQNGSEGLFPFGASRIPDTENLKDIRENHTYYLSRIDKVVLKNSLSGEVSFDVVTGTDALVPKAPEDRENAMTLYTLTIPAYTHNADDVDVKYIENKRYTMKDLGRVENRVDSLEYFTTLSLLENEIDARQISSVGSTLDSAFKNGILVDSYRTKIYII